MPTIKKFAIPLIIIALLILFLAIYLFSRAGAQESINLSVSPADNQANVIASTVSVTPSITHGTPISVPQPQDALSALRNIPDASAFVSLLQRTGVASEISLYGTYTFFVPTNEVFASSKYPLQYLSAPEQKRFAEFHIFDGKMMSLDDIKAGHMIMMSRDQLNDTVFDVASVEGNTHVVATYRAPNGIIYMVDQLLLPPEELPFPFK